MRPEAYQAGLFDAEGTVTLDGTNGVVCIMVAQKSSPGLLRALAELHPDGTIRGLQHMDEPNDTGACTNDEVAELRRNVRGRMFRAEELNANDWSNLLSWRRRGFRNHDLVKALEQHCIVKRTQLLPTLAWMRIQERRIAQQRDGEHFTSDEAAELATLADLVLKNRREH